MPTRFLANVGQRASGLEETLNVALLGFGTVGSAFAEVLSASGRSDIRITRVFNREVERKRTHAKASFVAADAYWTSDIQDVLNDPDVHLVLELMGGLDPAEGWITAALKAGKHVVTANKQLIALRGPSLFSLAQQHGVQLLYGAAVAGGVPVIPGISEGISGDRIHRISGILNGTCNFILSAMEAGADYPRCWRKAQEPGYAEADPSADVDGHDARAKLCILTRLALEAEIDPALIPAQTISRVNAIDFAYARELGCTVRQVSRAQIDKTAGTGTVRARVGPHVGAAELTHCLVARHTEHGRNHGALRR